MTAARAIKKNRSAVITREMAKFRAQCNGMHSLKTIWRDRQCAKESKLAEAARQASREWKAEQRELRMRSLDWGDQEPDPAWDLKSPWWVLEHLDDAVLIMAVCEKGAPAPDWPSVAKIWRERFNAKAREAHSVVEASLNFHREWRDISQAGTSDYELWSDGRMARVSVGYDAEDEEFWDSMAGPYRDLIGQPHGRREKRRRGSQAPKRWRETFGSSRAENMWAAGMAVAWPLAPKLDIEFESMSALIYALEACGAKKAGICASFHERHGAALEAAGEAGAREAWELIEKGMLDPVRMKWALSEASLEAPASAGKQEASETAASGLRPEEADPKNDPAPRKPARRGSL